MPPWRGREDNKLIKTLFFFERVGNIKTMHIIYNYSVSWVVLGHRPSQSLGNVQIIMFTISDEIIESRLIRNIGRARNYEFRSIEILSIKNKFSGDLNLIMIVKFSNNILFERLIIGHNIII